MKKQSYPPPPTFSVKIRGLVGNAFVVLLSCVAFAGWAQPMQCVVIPGNASSNPAPRPNPNPQSILPCLDVQNVRVNVHFLQHSNGTGNFTANDDGRPGAPGTSMTGYNYAQALIWAANGQMAQNANLNLAPGSAVSPLPGKRVQWVLDGVYFDKNSSYRDGAYNPNHAPPLYGRDYASLCIKADSIINLFLVEEEIWPYVGPVGNVNTNSPVRVPAIRGYVFAPNQARCDAGSTPDKMWAIVSSPWTKYILSGTNAYEIAGAVNHELCHLLGLNHPFESNSYNWGVCADAPMNANCWNINEPAGPDCNAWNKVSNNLMDYNAAQSSLAPCQIDIVQGNLNSCLKARYVYKCSNCLPTLANFELPARTCGYLTNIWLDGRSTWNNHYFTIEIDELNSTGIPINGTHFASGQYLRAVGREQLDALYTFIPNRTYRVKLITFNNCGSTSTKVRTFDTFYCMSTPQRTAQLPASTSTSSSRR